MSDGPGEYLDKQRLFLGTVGWAPNGNHTIFGALTGGQNLAWCGPRLGRQSAAKNSRSAYQVGSGSVLQQLLSQRLGCSHRRLSLTAYFRARPALATRMARELAA